MRKPKISVSLSFFTVLAIAATALVAVTFSVVIFASIYSDTFSDNAAVNAGQTTQQAAVAIDNTISSMKTQLKNLVDFMNGNDDGKNIYEHINSLIKFKDDIVAVTVYDDAGKRIMCASGDYKLKENVNSDLSFDKKMFDASPEFSLSAPHVQSTLEGVYPWVITAALKTEQTVLKTGKYVCIDFSFTQLADYIDNVGVGKHGYCYIARSGGKVVYHPQQQVVFSGLKSEDDSLVASLKKGTKSQDGKIVAVWPTSDAGWKIVGISYTDELSREKTTQIFFSITSALIFCAAVSILVLRMYQRIFNTPVRSLIKEMKEFENNANSFSYSPQMETVKELSELNNSFAHMANRIKKLMEQVRKEETELRKTELKALQAQINPHFLYNTLDSIQWMCERGKTKESAAMVGALARLFRISISRGHELIPIKDELQHAKSYLIIQSYRYKNQFSYKFDVDEELVNYLCNKITIQPLIENAIYHGIDRMVDEGEIIITLKAGEDCENDILITVEDNGVGMTEEQCKKILEKGRSDSSGIGVKNVNDRLKIYFGSKYGISINSEPDVGTVVTVRIPKIEKESDAWVKE